MNNIKVHLLIWAELDLNDDIYIMADDNMNCGILTGNIFLIFLWKDQEVVLDETLQRKYLKCFTV